MITHSATGLNATQDITVKTELTDSDGNTYPLVKIGDQLWMAKNLMTTKYNDGSEIPLVTDNAEWRNLNSPGYCWYNNDKISFSQTYGALYNWYTVETGKLCPSGWRVSSENDWHKLNYYTYSNDYLNAVATALKATSGWNHDGNGIDAFGFSALPGGRRDTSKITFYAIGNASSWWKSDEQSLTEAHSEHVSYPDSFIASSTYDKKFGFSVRCVRD